MATIILPALFAVGGALMYGLSANPKVAELGRLLFAAGVIAIAFAFTGRTFHF